MEGNFRILVAVRPDPLKRVILHLFRGVPHIEIVSCVGEPKHLVRHAERLLPHLIIVNNYAAVADARATVAALKNASPGAKLIFTSWGDDLTGRDRISNADAHINEASLIKKLIPTVHKLCASNGHKVSRRSIQRRYL